MLKKRAFAAMKRIVGLVLGVLIGTISAPPAHAQLYISLPPVNLGGTSFMDGVGGPGLLLREGPGVFDARRFTDANGATVPGDNSLFAFSSITLAAYMPPFKVLGGNWGAEVLVPVVYAHVTTPVGSGSATGLGDITFSPLVWQASTLLLSVGSFSSDSTSTSLLQRASTTAAPSSALEATCGA